MLISEGIHIWREPDGDYHIQWQVSDPDTQVVVEPLTAAGDLQIHYSEEVAQRARLVGLPPGSRHYFRLRDQHGNEVLATERKLGMQGTPNFRDFGGYRTSSGRQVKWGYLFRSGQLSRLSDQDLQLLDSLQLDLVFDFRRVEEQQADASRLPLQRRPTVISLPIDPGSHSQLFSESDREELGPAAMFDFMIDINRELAESQTPIYGRMFREILALDDARFLVHCAAGKDRTGFAAAIILLALGVPQETVMRDYLLTGQFFSPAREMDRLRNKYELEDMMEAAILPVLEVHQDYLGRALQVIEQNFGSVQQYLEQALDVGPSELAELRGRYLD